MLPRINCVIVLAGVVTISAIWLTLFNDATTEGPELTTLHTNYGWQLVGYLTDPFTTTRSLFFTAVLSIYSAFASSPSSTRVDAYLAQEVPIAKDNLIANIGPSGSRCSGAKAGIVIASPSTEDPDYLYTWTRDASLVFKNIIDRYTRGEDWSLRGTIDDFVAAQAVLQTVSNPSGTISTGGLGEPKFNIDLTAYTGSWGRPQRDGPALRAITLITYANWLVDNSNVTWAFQRVWPVIKLDLDYTARFWNYTGFDLWEEVSSSSFFTTAAQHRALREGAAFATRLGQSALAANYSTQAGNVFCFFQSYWNPVEGFATSNTGGGRSGKDANSVLASIHNFDPAAGCDATTFQPCSDKALSNLKVYVDSFRSIYKINSGIKANASVAIGRYSEDVYYGGQPWYLTTAAAAEQLYDAIIVWKNQGYISVTPTSLAFFRQFSSSITVGRYPLISFTYATLLRDIKAFADGFIAINAKYTPADGSLAEQYHRDDGVPLSAEHLTWNYASLLTANAARQGISQKSWGAKGLKVPSRCETNYGPTAQVTFNVYAETVLGENIFLVGSIGPLKNWSPETALALSPTNYPVWNVTVAIPVGTNFEYKYIRKRDGSIIWESDPNRSNSSPSSGSKTIDDVWR